MRKIVNQNSDSSEFSDTEVRETETAVDELLELAGIDVKKLTPSSSNFDSFDVDKC